MNKSCKWMQNSLEIRPNIDSEDEETKEYFSEDEPKIVPKKELKRGTKKKQKQLEKKIPDDDSESMTSTQSEAFGSCYDQIINCLHLSYIPEVLPCRDEEKEIIESFIEIGLQNHGSSTSLYISGVPGTGKTATALEVINNMKNKKLFKFIHMNGMQLKNPNAIFSLIYKEITGKKAKPQSAAVCLNDYFKRRKDLTENQLKNETSIVLLVDELDALINKKQNVLYNLFNWPSNKNSGLTILAIANTMDLPERFLPKIKSRIGETRLVYKCYNQQQIEDIISDRLGGNEIFEKYAIKFVAKKVSSFSGDIRRALQVCKRAVEIAK